MPINEEKEEKARQQQAAKVKNLRNRLNRKKHKTEDDELLLALSDELNSYVRHNDLAIATERAKLKGFKKELLETGRQQEFMSFERLEKIENLEKALAEKDAEHEKKLRTMQPVSATAELQVEVQQLNERLQRIRKVVGNSPHTKECATMRVNSPNCTCWKALIEEQF